MDLWTGPNMVGLTRDRSDAAHTTLRVAKATLKFSVRVSGRNSVPFAPPEWSLLHLYVLSFAHGVDT